MQRVRLVLRAAGILLGFLVYLWFAGVRYADEVRRRKALRRAAKSQP